MKKFLFILIALFVFTGKAHGASRYWVGGGSSTNWNATGNTNWSETSGGANNASVPTSADDVFFDSNSGTYTSNISASINIQSLTITQAGTLSHATASDLRIGGNMTLFSGMTYTITDNTSAIVVIADSNITTAGKSMGTITINGSGITVNLQDALSQTVLNGTVVLKDGNLNTNNFNITTRIFRSDTTNTRTINLGSSTITLLGNIRAWDIDSQNLTFNADTSDIILQTGGTFPRIFEGNNLTYNNLSITQTGTGDNTIEGSNTFNNFSITSTGVAKTILFQGGTTQTVSSFSSDGSLGNLITLTSTSTSDFILLDTSGTNSMTYTNVSSSTVSGGATWNACTSDGNVNGGGNFGWDFSCTYPSGNFDVKSGLLEIKSGIMEIK